MVVITFILFYILVGLIVAIILGWDEITTIFKRWDKNEVTKGEAQEFLVLIGTYILGWGLFALYVLIIDPLKTLLGKNKKL